MRNIEYIAVHCTATGQNTTVESIKKYWKEKLGWKSPGYHYIIDKDGKIFELLPEANISNGVKGFNSKSINIAYIGGIDLSRDPIDNRTFEQKMSLKALLITLQEKYLDAVIQGHRDFSPDLNNDGEISEDEFIKHCPSFDVKQWLHDINFYEMLTHKS